jgi:hypothetical protein
LAHTALLLLALPEHLPAPAHYLVYEMLYFAILFHSEALLKHCALVLHKNYVFKAVAKASDLLVHCCQLVCAEKVLNYFLHSFLEVGLHSAEYS